MFKPEIWSAGADNSKTTIVIDPALPPQNTETFRFPTCLAATARRSVQFFPYPVGRTTKTCRPAALQPSKHIIAWVLGFKFREPCFLKQNVTRYRTRCLYCTHQSMSDLEHAQLTRGPDSGPRNRILPDLVSSSPFPSPLPCFLSSNLQNEIWGRDHAPLGLSLTASSRSLCPAGRSNSYSVELKHI